ncbi:hypothetical protein HJC23_011305 [Cyclotella cryptica]|uniref:J domain-containing protein n=1 Tax=Cyclotella cryptica TaxID=29204 RepID=A0ABD3QVR5_9STRA|eukprot:CCRYP_001707-RA/>CCRYP_001707-RA protein AED:0.02 eAED:0.02 QI:240/1/1/1/0.75/0.6/5/321/545
MCHLWRNAILIALLFVLVHDNQSGFRGIKSVAAQYGNRYEQKDRVNRRRQKERNYGNQQQNPWTQFGGGNSNGSGGGNQYKQRQQNDSLYKTLNVSKDATEKEIKSSYRKLALKFHPDKFKPNRNLSDQVNEKNRAKQEERFVKIAQAYDILGDEKKRRVYDKFGMDGVELLAKGHDPEENGGFGGFSNAGSNGGYSNFNEADAAKIFEKMFANGGMGGFNMGSMGGMGGFEKMFTGGIPNMGGFSGGGFSNKGGFPGGGFTGRGGGTQGQRDGQRSRKPEEAPPAFSKDDESGVVSLGERKFPDARSKHAWLIYFYDKNNVSRDPTTREYVAVAKQLSKTLLRKAKGKKDAMMFKVGAVDCSGNTNGFCESKLGSGVKVPTFAIVLNGKVDIIPEDDRLNDAKFFHDKTIEALLNMKGLLANINSIQHVKTRLLGSSPRPGQTTVAILLLTEKYDTSSMFRSLAYRHRRDGFVFGESRAKNLQLGKEFNVSSRPYPHLLAIIGNSESHVVERFDGESMDLDSLSRWTDAIGKKHFKYGPKKSRS